MNAPVFALFARSLRHEARWLGAYAIRLALVGLIFLSLLFAEAKSVIAGAPGLDFFQAVVGINFFFITLAGLSYFATAITEEKEEGTLGLLRMTDMSPLVLLLGKSTSRLLGALMLLGAQLPFALLAVTLGGISTPQIVAAYATLFGYIFFLCNLALFFSVVGSRSSLATLLTFLFLTGFLLPPVVGVHVTFLDNASPFLRMGKILTTGFHEPVAGFQVGSQMALGLLFFLLAWIVFPIFCEKQHGEAEAKRWLTKRSSLFRGLAPGRVWARPLIWKDFYFFTGGKFGLLIRFILLGTALGVYVFWNLGFVDAPDWSLRGMAISFFSAWLMQMEMAVQASRMFRQEIDLKTLPNLLTLPLTTAEIVKAKFLGILYGMIPYGVAMAVGLVMMIWGILISVDSGKGMGFGALALLGMIAVILFALLFQYFVASLSLTMRRGALALAVGMLTIGVFGWCFAPIVLLISPLLIRAIHENIVAQLQKSGAEG